MYKRIYSGRFGAPSALRKPFRVVWVAAAAATQTTHNMRAAQRRKGL